MALSGIYNEVTRPRVAAVLLERPARLLTDTSPESVAQFEAHVHGAGVEVALTIGTNATAGPIRALGVEAITLETGSRIEYALFPEQQGPGDPGRGYYLHRRYLELLARLQTIMDRLAGVIPATEAEQIAAVNGGTGKPRGRFPKPAPYPDPAGRR